MTEKDEFLKAQKVVEQYNCKVNNLLIGKTRLCICCKRNEIKPCEGWSLDTGYIDVLEQEVGMWSGGTVERINFGYGSTHDMQSFYVAICDECIEQLKNEGHAIDCKVLRKKKNELIESDDVE